MKKTLLICSDIDGTYNVLNTRKQIETLKYIDDIKTKLGLDQAVISFVSALSCKEIEEVVNNILLPVLEETKLGTIVGPHFGSDGYTYNGSSPKIFIKDSKKGAQMAKLVDLFDTFLPDSKVSEFIYIDDAPNINPALFLMNIKNSKKELEHVTFLVKKDDIGDFLKTDNFPFDINIIEKKSDDFLMTGMAEINNSIDSRKKAR